MRAVLYTFADKFLDKDDLSRVKEVIGMTRLGQMLFDDGIKCGIEQGIEQGICAMIRDKLEDGICDERICEKLQKHFSLTREEAEAKLQEYKPQP